MQFIYQTDRLQLKILSQDYGEAVHCFYESNKEFLERFEPKRPENFYSDSFHSTNLSYEYRGFLNFSHFRYWLFPREAFVTPGIVPMGSLCFNNIQRGAFQKCTLGYKLGQAACHQGYMSEALSFIIPLLMEELKLHRIEAYVQPDYTPSIRLLAKLGFQEEGYLSSYAEINGDWKDHLIFSYISSMNQ